MKTQTFRKIRAMGLAVILSLLATTACNKDHSFQDDKNHGSSVNTAVRVFLTDDPSLVFDAILLDIQKVEIKAEDHDQAEHEIEHQGEEDDNDHHGDSAGGWINLSIHPGVYDILKFRNGLDTLLGTGNFLTANSLRKIRITLGNNNSVIFNGSSFPLLPKDHDNIVIIKLSDDFGLSNSGQLDFSLDFDAGRSIRLHGNQFELDAQVKAFRREKAGSIEGRVLPVEANPVVMAIIGSDTSTAKPEREGEFKIVGLKSGIYSVLFHATAGNFSDSTVQNVLVQEQEDTHIATITLHP
jgi:hypothetical protein